MVPILRQYMASWRCDPAIRVHFIDPRVDLVDGLTCLFSRPYLNVIGSMVGEHYSNAVL